MDKETLDVNISMPDKPYIILILCFIICLGSLVYFIRNYNRGYSLKKFGEKFNKPWYAFWSKYGLRRSDYMKFKINIRTTDASEDCKINGEFTRGKLTNVRIRGSGDKCEELKKTKKIDK